MRLTEFWGLMDAHFGAGYSRSVARDYMVPTLSATVDDAIAAGEDPKTIWRAVCAEFDVPKHLR